MPFPTGYTLWDEIVINHLKVGTGGTTNQDIWIPLTSLSGTAQATLLANGGDARFTLDDGTTQLAGHATLDSAGVLTGFRFKPSSLSDTVDTIIRLWYNGADAALAVGDPYGQYATYDANTVGYWPLEEDPSGTAPQMLDRTSGATHGTTNGSMTSGDLIAGQVGNALDLDGANDSVALDYAIMSSPTEFTVETIAKATNTATEYRLFSLGNSSMFVELRFNSLGVAGRISVHTRSGGADISVQTDAYDITQFHHIMASVQNNGTIDLIIDGVLAATTAMGSISGFPANGFYIGASYGNDTWTLGVMDEVKLHSVYRSLAWAIVRANNEKTPATFFSSVTAMAASFNFGPPTLGPFSGPFRRR
ncbi:MAG: LamG domain-containing protein [Phycisphaeraceae bacterium]|nr:LamG domain-containing protein [Phycisphaeraceae bacterium]